jgi:hypothetical protein
MPTMRNQSPAALAETGDAVLAAAKTQDTKPIKAKLAAFAKLHGAFLAAEKKVGRAEALLRAQQAKVAEADSEQDALIEQLARERVTDGAARAQPFKALGFDAPSAIRGMAVKKEAALVRKLAKKAASAAGASKGTLATAKALDKAGAAVLAHIDPIRALEKAYADALSARNALGQPWATALAMLKRAARVAEDDGVRGLHAALFASSAPVRRARAAKPAPPPAPPAPEPPVAPDGAPEG